MYITKNGWTILKVGYLIELRGIILFQGNEWMDYFKGRLLF